jgi:uncharacterized membrane protein YdbT with pleckstrin-like domain
MSNAIHNSTGQNGAETLSEVNIDWSYSGKAMRAQVLLFFIISSVMVGGGVYATLAGWLDSLYPVNWWCAMIVGLALLWGYYYTVYFYRVLTIRYRLTDRHLYAHKGLFTRTCDSMELIHINDVRLVQTLFDRLFNGGVGRLIIFCPVDKTDSELVLTGIDKPKEIFEKINSLRTALRAKRSILTGGM